MEDEKIVDLYWARSEKAVSETAAKYGKYCRTIAFNILANDEDAEECLNDTYLKDSFVAMTLDSETALTGAEIDGFADSVSFASIGAPKPA